MSEKHLPSNINRDFKGIWIPREIWLNKTLSIQAKALWAEIWSLHDREIGGCFASNEYLCEFMDIKLSRLKEIMKELRDSNFIIDVSFDGRHRVIRAQMPEVEYGGQQMATKPASCQPENRPPPSRDSGSSHYIDTSIDKRIDTPPTPNVSADAEVGGNCFSSSSKKANKKDKDPELPKDTYLQNIFLSKQEHTNLLEEHGEKPLAWMLEVLSAYIGSTGKVYKSHYHLMVKGGWVYKRLQEEKGKNPHFQPLNSYQRSGKMVIKADIDAKPTEREHYQHNISDEEEAAMLAKLKASRKS